MTRTLEIPGDLDAQIERDARERGTDPASWLIEAARFVLNSRAQKQAQARADEAARFAAIDAGFGMFAGKMGTSDEFLEQRHAEGEADYLAGAKG